MKLEIITPKKKVIDREIISITLPSSEGEITVLAHHNPLLTVLVEGIITYRMAKGEEDYLAIGAGYMQTDGVIVRILVSRAYGQDEIDEKLTEEAVQQAKKVLAEVSDQSSKADALSLIRRSMIDSKLRLKKRRSVIV